MVGEKNKTVVVVAGAFFISFLFLINFPEQLWGGGLEAWAERENEGNETASNVFANLALLCFIIGNVYSPAKWIVKNISPEKLNLKKNMSNLLEMHIFFNILAFIFSCFHAYYAEQSNILLFLSMVMITWLTFQGFLMRFKFDRDFKRRMCLLHSQQTLLGILILLLIAGHVISG